MPENFDYVQTPEAVCIQLGTHSKPGTILAAPIYVADENGNRVFSNRKYRKTDDDAGIYEQFKTLTTRNDLGYRLVQVPLETVLHTYEHRQFMIAGRQHIVADILEDVLETRISMIGSCLVNADQPTSDWDYVLYGQDTYDRVQDRWEKVLEATGGIEREDDKQKRAEKYARWHGLDANVLASLFARRKGHFFLKDGTHISLIPTYDTGEAIMHPHEPSMQQQHVQLRDTVVDDAHRAMMPRLYRCEQFDVWSFRWMDCDLARAGETVRISGSMLPDGKTVILNRLNDYLLPESHERRK